MKHQTLTSSLIPVQVIQSFFFSLFGGGGRAGRVNYSYIRSTYSIRQSSFQCVPATST